MCLSWQEWCKQAVYNPANEHMVHQEEGCPTRPMRERCSWCHTRTPCSATGGRQVAAAQIGQDVSGAFHACAAATPIFCSPPQQTQRACSLVWSWRSLTQQTSQLDPVTQAAKQLSQTCLERLLQRGPGLICCTLGRGRQVHNAAAVAILQEQWQGDVVWAPGTTACLDRTMGRAVQLVERQLGFVHRYRKAGANGCRIRTCCSRARASSAEGRLLAKGWATSSTCGMGRTHG